MTASAARIRASYSSSNGARGVRCACACPMPRMDDAEGWLFNLSESFSISIFFFQCHFFVGWIMLALIQAAQDGHCHPWHRLAWPFWAGQTPTVQFVAFLFDHLLLCLGVVQCGGDDAANAQKPCSALGGNVGF